MFVSACSVPPPGEGCVFLRAPAAGLIAAFF